MGERLSAALRVAGSIPAQKEYLYGVQIVVWDLDVNTRIATGEIARVGDYLLFLKKTAARFVSSE